MTFRFAICTDENFVIPALVCITSIFENNKNHHCEVTVLTDGICNESLDKFNKLASYYSQEIKVVHVSQTRFENMVTRGRYPASMYFRFLLPELLPDTSKVLYLDCDIMVRRDLNELFDTKLTEYASGVVLDQQCDDIQIINRLHLTTPYFNSGVMLMNLDEWRQKDYTNRLLAFIENNPDKCEYPDQDALNCIIGGHVRLLNPSYNLQEMWLTMMDYARFHFSRHDDLEHSKQNPHIIHFCVGDKPWYNECKNPYRKEYLSYAVKHDFIVFKTRNHYSKLYYRFEAEIQRLRRWQQRFVKK